MSTLILLAVVIIVVLWAIGAYNGLSTLATQVERAWDKVDGELKRRHEVVDNFITILKDKGVEGEPINRLMDARKRAVNAGTISEKEFEERELSEALKIAYGTIDGNPELRDSEEIRRIREEIEAVENRVGFTSQFYNDLATKFNTKQSIFPTLVIARALGFSRVDGFMVEQEKEASEGREEESGLGEKKEEVLESASPGEKSTEGEKTDVAGGESTGTETQETVGSTGQDSDED